MGVRHIKLLPPGISGNRHGLFGLEALSCGFSIGTESTRHSAENDCKLQDVCAFLWKRHSQRTVTV